jgi:hypothetical protein
MRNFVSVPTNVVVAPIEWRQVNPGGLLTTMTFPVRLNSPESDHPKHNGK